VLYEMLVGEPPFGGPTAQAIIARVLTEEPRSLTLQRRTVPPHVEAAVLKALAKLPADRFQRASEFALALATATVAGPAGTAAGPPAAARAAGPPARRVAPTVILAAVALAAAGLAVWGWLRVRRAERQPAAWQYVSLGDSSTLVTDYPGMALSPDGRMLVYKDTRQNGLLWLKQRGRLDPTPIPGTERAQNPVFSPDNEWVAFVADGHLKKVRPSGGPTITIADSVAIGYGGAAWLDDGTLVYVSASLIALHRVNASGGSSTPVLNDTSFGGGGIGHPVPLPNARGVLMQVCSSGCVSMSIHVVDLRTGTHALLLDDVAQAWYLPMGRLLYVRRDGVALAAPFDLDRLEITGEAVPVLEGVDVRPANGFALLTWSAAGSVVYVHGGGTGAENTVVRVGRDGTIAPIDTAWYGEFNSLALAPDGRRVAVGVGSGAGLNIWVKQLERGPFTRLTFGNRDRRPAWSPDGRIVAYVRDSANTSAVFARPADGSGPDRPLARLDRMVQEVTWSPDGRWVVMRTDNTVYGAGDLVGVPLTGDSTPVPLASSGFTELHPAVSPDGRWLAYTSNESGVNEVYVRPFPNTAAVRWQVSNGGGDLPVWSPTGRELLYLDPATSLLAAVVRPGPTFAVDRLVRMLDASGFVYDAFHPNYGVAPDGRSFLFLAPRRMTVTGRGPRLVWVDHWFSDIAARLQR
jgi:serine/threonine-protein kinase